jgi:hypothetical protein
LSVFSNLISVLFYGCRRDSFITHRAFCDVLSQESAISISAVNPLFSSHSQFNHHSHNFQPPFLKKEQDLNILRPEIIPSWFPSSSTQQQLLPTHFRHYHQNPNPTTLFHSNFNSNNIITSSPHMSATALLQKASQIGVTVSKTEPCIPHLIMQTHHVPFMASSREEIGNSTTGFSHCLASYGNKAVTNTEQESSLLHDVIFGSNENSSQFESVTAGMNMRGGMFDPQIDNNNFEGQYSNFGKSNNIMKGGGGVHAINDDEMTRDFLSLGAFSQRDDLLFGISGIHDHPLGSLSYGKQNQNQILWRRG